MATYKLTKTAEKDIQKIFEYGIKQFGAGQAIKFLQELEKTLI